MTVSVEIAEGAGHAVAGHSRAAGIDHLQGSAPVILQPLIGGDLGPVVIAEVQVQISQASAVLRTKRWTLPAIRERVAGEGCLWQKESVRFAHVSYTGWKHVRCQRYALN